MNPTLRTTLYTVVLMLAPVVVILTARLVGDLPDLLPRHWGEGNEVDGTWRFSAAVTSSAGITFVLSSAAAGLLWARCNRGTLGLAVPMIGWLSWFLTGIFVATLLASSGVARAEDVPLPVGGMAISIVLATALAWLLHRLLPPFAESGDAVATQSPNGLDLAAGEKIVWVGEARSTALGASEWH